MSNILSKKEIVSFLQLSEEGISCWDKIEAHLNCPCDNLNDLLSKILEALDVNRDKEDLPDINSIKRELESTLKSEYNRLLEEARQSLEHDLQTKIQQERELLSNEHQEKIEQLTRSHSLELSTQKNQNNDLCNTLIKIVELYDRSNDDDRLNPQLVIEEIEKLSESALSRMDITLKNSVGEIYDSKYQNIVSVVPTDDKGQDKIVVESLSRGILLNGQCIKEQDVIIAKYKES